MSKGSTSQMVDSFNELVNGCAALYKNMKPETEARNKESASTDD